MSRAPKAMRLPIGDWPGQNRRSRRPADDERRPMVGPGDVASLEQPHAHRAEVARRHRRHGGHRASRWRRATLPSAECRSRCRRRRSAACSPRPPPRCRRDLRAAIADRGRTAPASCRCTAAAAASRASSRRARRETRVDVEHAPRLCTTSPAQTSSTSASDVSATTSDRRARSARVPPGRRASAVPQRWREPRARRAERRPQTDDEHCQQPYGEREAEHSRVEPEVGGSNRAARRAGSAPSESLAMTGRAPRRRSPTRRSRRAVG